MESKNTFILHETEAFMRGELDNVTVAHGRIVLDLVSGGHVPYGCYTSPAVPLPTFDALRVSWNAGTPPGTAVEAQARVMVDGNWTSWSSFGRWSPYLEREGAAPVTKGAVNLLPDSLVLDSKPPPKPSCASTCIPKTNTPPLPSAWWGSACER
ncbi:MAG: hypothetical protein ACLTGG_11730 [Subdoligranulum sp.]